LPRRIGTKIQSRLAYNPSHLISAHCQGVWHRRAFLLSLGSRRRGDRIGAPAASWCDPAGESLAQVKGSSCLVASVARCGPSNHRHCRDVHCHDRAVPGIAELNGELTPPRNPDSTQPKSALKRQIREALSLLKKLWYARRPRPLLEDRAGIGPPTTLSPN
jgi:hypothetical protein